MVGGMVLAASQISPNVAPTPLGLAFMAANSAASIGSSGTLRIDQYTVVKDSNAPTMKAAMVICGMWLLPTASLFIPSKTKIVGAK